MIRERQAHENQRQRAHQADEEKKVLADPKDQGVKRSKAESGEKKGEEQKVMEREAKERDRKVNDEGQKKTGRSQ